MQPVNFNLIIKEIQDYTEELKQEGKNKEQIRELVVLSLDKTVIDTFQQLEQIIIRSPQAGFNLAYYLHKSLGGVNQVMIEEGIEPIHVKEPKFLNEVLLKSMEEYANLPIEEIFARMEYAEKQNLKGGNNNE